MISWIALILVIGAIGFEIHLRNKNDKCQCRCNNVDPEKEQLKIQHEEYRNTIMLIENIAIVPKLFHIKEAIFKLNKISEACRSSLGEQNEIQ